jgi:hypothetical protein
MTGKSLTFFYSVVTVPRKSPRVAASSCKADFNFTGLAAIWTNFPATGRPKKLLLNQEQQLEKAAGI